MLMEPSELATIVLVRVEIGEAFEGCFQLEDQRINADTKKKSKGLPHGAEQNWVGQRTAMSLN